MSRLGNVKFKSFLGTTKTKGYLGNIRVFGSEPWEDALEDAGYSPSSLEETLKDSEACTIIANNDAAVAFIKENYQAQLHYYIDNNFSDGLNLLCYKCKTKTYLFKEGNRCTNITGGWTVDNGSFGSNYVEVHGVYDWDKANSYDGYGGEAGGAYTVNKLQLTGFSKYGCYCAVDSGGYSSMDLAMGGSVNNGNSYWYQEGYTQNAFVSTTNDIEATTYYTTETMDDTKRASVRASDPSSHPGNDSIIYNIKGTFYKIWVEPEYTDFNPDEPFNKALSLVGLNYVTNIESLLTNSVYCAALANNTEAVAIMKSNYSSQLTSYIDSNWSEGLNALNYACKLKCYLYNEGNQCQSITGGWTAKWAVVLAGAEQSASTNDNGTIYMYFRRTNGDGLYRDSCTASTVNDIDVNGYNSISWTIAELSGQGRKQMQYGSSNYSDGITSTGTHSYTAKSGAQKFYWSNVPHSDVGTQKCRVSMVCLIP